MERTAILLQCACVTVLSCLLAVVSPGLGSQSVKFGVLPVLDTLPLYVAVKDGFFKGEGLDVELVSFNSALERDIAMQSGRLDGYFGDLLNSLLLIQTKVPMRIITISYATLPGQRMFALMASPSSQINDTAQLNGQSVGISSATIIEFLLQCMLAQAHVPDTALHRLEIKKIPIRLQMLLAGQLDTALLPEPMVTLAEHGGARVLMTDEHLNQVLTVLCLHEKLLADNAQILEGFLKAYGKAVQRLAEQPEAYRTLLAEVSRIPDPILKTFKIPRYPPPQLPSPEAVRTVQQWMIKRQLLTTSFPYNQLAATPQSDSSALQQGDQ